jgi:hypothetical protein
MIERTWPGKPERTRTRTSRKTTRRTATRRLERGGAHDIVMEKAARGFPWEGFRGFTGGGIVFHPD